MNILIADDHQILRQGLKALLKRQPDMNVVGEVSNGRDALNKVKKLKPDIVVMDIVMPDMNGVDATIAIKNFDDSIKIVALSMHANASFIYEMFKAGASAFLVKDCAFEELEEAVRAAFHGKQYIGACLKDVVSELFLDSIKGEKKKTTEALSRREIQILTLIAEGLTNKDISTKLHLSMNTVASHRQHIMKKLGLQNTVELTKYAIRKKYVKL